MSNFFGMGLIAGINSQEPYSSQHITRYCEDFRRGYVIGYTHSLMQLSGDSELVTRVAGSLTQKYGLNKEMMMEIYTEFQQDSSTNSFISGYAAAAQT